MLPVLFRAREHRHIVPAQCVDLLEGPLQQGGGFHFFRSVLRHGDGIPPGSISSFSSRRGGEVFRKLCPHAAVLHRLVGVTAGDHRFPQALSQTFGQSFRPLAVRGQVLAV